MPKLNGLSLKQQKFIDAYVGEAVTKPKIAKEIGKRLLSATQLLDSQKWQE